MRENNGLNLYQSVNLKTCSRGAILGLFCLALLVFANSPASGEELQTFGSMPNAKVIEKSIGTLQIKLSTREALNLSSLMQGISETDTIESAYSKIDALRNKLYPRAEILVEIGNLGVVPLDCSQIYLVKKIVWFNSAYEYGDGWVAANIDSAAACCVVKVRVGTFKHYYQRADGTWALGGTTYAGGVWTTSTNGSYLDRGFKGRAVADGKTSRADIVMYFYD